MKGGIRQLYEKSRIEASLSAIGWFHYIAHFPNGLTENEIDHVLIGIIPDDQPIKPNPEEVPQVQWINIDDLNDELDQLPEKYTPWISKALQIVKDHLINTNV